MEADVDRRPALEARQAPSLLHRAKLSTIESEARSPWAAIAIAAQELARGEDHPAKLGVVDISDLRPGPRAGDEQRLVLDLVPDSRKGALVEEGGGDIALRLRAQPANALVEIEVIGDHIRPELGNHGMERHFTGGHELDDGRGLAGGDVLVRADHDARLGRGEPPALPRSVHVPLPLHAHVRVEDHVLSIRRERDQEVLAIRLDRLHRAADHPATRRRGSHLRRNEIESGDHATGERATEHARRTKDRVAFGHSASGAGDATEIAARRPRKAGLMQRLGERRLINGSAIDGLDEESGPPIGSDLRRERGRERLPGRLGVRFVGDEREELLLAATEPSGDPAIDQNDHRARGTHGFAAFGSIRP